MKIVIDFTQLEYLETKGTLDRILNTLAISLRKLFGMTPTLPPFRRKGIKRLLSPTYKELGKTICLNDVEANQILIEHNKRLDFHTFLTNSLYYFSAFSIALIILISTSYIFPNLGLLKGQNNGNSAISIGLSIISAALAMRIAVLLVDKGFADTLAIVSNVYLLIFLEREKTLANPDSRRAILDRMRILRKNIVLLARTFADGNDIWPNQHIKHIENFVREREHWVVAPQQQTLDDLRKDFSYLLDILITGEYGYFLWETDEKVVEVEMTKSSISFINKFIRIVLILFPFVLLATLYFVPDKIAALGVDASTIFLISLALILLIIDAYLNLGIVERVMGLAKTMKDLR